MTDRVRFDLHVHSMYSPDSRLPLDAIVGRLSYVGLKGFALTDHNTVDGHRALRDLASRNSSYLLVPGVEVSTLEGHLLAYGVETAPPPNRPVAETIEWVRGHGGEAVPAHPFRRNHGIGPRATESVTARALETRNGHNSELANVRAEEVAARRGLGGTGGSDAHGLADVGRAFTEVEPSIASVEDLLEALRRGTVSADGRSMPFSGRVRLGLRSGVLWLGRGFRPI
jgi:predicted metal-dependent phosphoesterase TrpH